jgi:hypothetical protein
MTTKEKAEELVRKYYTFGLNNTAQSFSWYECKECALIGVDEIMKAPFENIYLELVSDDAPDTDWYWDKFREYWEEVKDEINNL